MGHAGRCDAGCAILAMNPPHALGIIYGQSVAVAATGTGVASVTTRSSSGPTPSSTFMPAASRFSVSSANNRMGMTGGRPVPDILRYITWADPVVCAAGGETHAPPGPSNPTEPCTVMTRVLPRRCIP